MRVLVLLICIMSFALVGCATNGCNTAEKADWTKALNAAEEARVSAENAEAAAMRAVGAADSAAISADKSAGAAMVAEDAAEKAIKAFEMKQRK